MHTVHRCRDAGSLSAITDERGTVCFERATPIFGDELGSCSARDLGTTKVRTPAYGVAYQGISSARQRGGQSPTISGRRGALSAPRSHPLRESSETRQGADEDCDKETHNG
jgi:hypothetical protein